MPHIKILVFAIIAALGFSCASSKDRERTTQPRPTNPYVDPMDPLIASSAMALRFHLDEPEAIAETLASFDRRDESPMAAAVDNAQLSLLDTITDLVGDPKPLSGVDEDQPAYLALSLQGNQRFLNALELSPIIPVEAYPDWLHIRFVIGAKKGRADKLRKELARQLKPADRSPSQWRLTTEAHQIVADTLIPLSPKAHGQSRPNFTLLDVRPRIGTRHATAARTRFSHSTAPASLYVDYRRVGKLLAIFEAGTTAGRFADEIADSGGAGLPLFGRWIRANTTAYELASTLATNRAEFADATVEANVQRGELELRVTSTRTDVGLNLRKERSSELPGLDVHRDRPAVLRFESAGPFAQPRRRPALSRWIADGDHDLDSIADLVARFRDSAPWTLLQRPVDLFAALLSSDGILPAPQSIRLTVYEPVDPYVFPVALSASFDAATHTRTQLMRSLERNIGDDFQWTLEDNGDHYHLRATQHADVDELMDKAAPKTGAQSLHISAHPEGVRHWKAVAGDSTPPVIPAELFAITDREFTLSAGPAEHYTVLTLRTVLSAGSTIDDHIEGSDAGLPNRAVIVSEVVPPCALDVRAWIDQSVGEIQRASPSQRSRTIDRRVLPTLDRSRRCESDHPQLPRFSKVLARNLWYLGLREQREGRLAAAFDLFSYGCEIDDPLSCQYRDRVRHAATIDFPVANRPLRSTPRQSPLSGFVRTFVSVDDSETVSVGHRAIAGFDELSRPRPRQQVRDAIADTPMSSPLALTAGEPELHRRARHTVGVVAAPHLKARSVLTPFSDPGADQPFVVQPYIRLTDDPSSLPVTPQLRVTSMVPYGGDQIRVHLRDDGIDVVAGGTSLPTQPGCPRSGPTICKGAAPSDEGLPIDGLYSVMPTIADWVAGRGALTIVVETELSWGLLGEIALLVQNPTHSVWKTAAPTRLLGFTQRMGTPYSQITIAVPDPPVP